MRRELVVALASLVLVSAPARGVEFDVIVPTRIQHDSTGISGIGTGTFGWLVATTDPISRAAIEAAEITVTVFPRIPIILTQVSSGMALTSEASPLQPGEVLGRDNEFDDVFEELVEPLLLTGETLKDPTGPSGWGVTFLYPRDYVGGFNLVFEVRIGGDEATFTTRLELGPDLVPFFVEMQRVSTTSIPIVSVTLNDSLLVDLNGNRKVDAGDTLRYTVLIRNTGSGLATGVKYEDTPPALTRLDAGSVRADLGVVTRGNSPGDIRAIVETSSIPPGGGTERITYDAVVDQALPLGVLELVNQGTVSGNFGRLPTDDATTSKKLDATRTPLANTLLDRCDNDRRNLEEDLLVCEEDLTAAFADEDGDGVIDAVDHCAATSEGRPTDALGCSQSQFCESQAVAAASGNRFRATLHCVLADWRNDEPRWARDCRPGPGGCEARVDD